MRGEEAIAVTDVRKSRRDLEEEGLSERKRLKTHYCKC